MGTPTLNKLFGPKIAHLPALGFRFVKGRGVVRHWASAFDVPVGCIDGKYHEKDVFFRVILPHSERPHNTRGRA